MWGVGYVGPITDELWVVSRLSMYRGLLIDCTSCWLLSHLGLLRLERSGVRVLVFYLVLPVYHWPSNFNEVKI